MPIIANPGLEFPDAGSLLVPPVTAGDCPGHDSLEELVTEEEENGTGATIRSGVAFTMKTPAELVAVCTI